MPKKTPKETQEKAMDTTFFKTITPTIATMLTGYITVSDGFLAPLAVVMETMPSSMAWLDTGMDMALYMT